MSDRPSQRIRRIMDSTKKLKERMTALTSMKEEGFTEAELAEVFTSAAPGVYQVYRDWCTYLENESNQRGKQLTHNECAQHAAIVRGILVHCADNVKNGFESASLHDEVAAFLHVENHVTVRRLGVDLLVQHMDALRTDEKGLDRELVDRLASAVDWEYFRTQQANPVIMPSTISEVRGARHSFYPRRTRSTSTRDEIREREACDMVRTICRHISEKCAPGRHLEAWWAAFKQTILPLLYPKEAFNAGLLPAEVWDGFCNGAPALLHKIVAEMLVALSANPNKAACTIAASDEDFKFFLTALVLTPQTLQTPAVETVWALQQLVATGHSGSKLYKTHAGAVFQQYVGNAIFSVLPTPIPEESADEAELQMVHIAVAESIVDFLAHICSSNLFASGIKHVALDQLLNFASAASEHHVNPSAELTDVIREIYPLVCQCAWHAIVSVASPDSKTFVDLVQPTLSHIASVTPDGSPEECYLFKCWLAVLEFANRCLCEVNGSHTQVIFAWPEVKSTVKVTGIAKLRRTNQLESTTNAGEVIKMQLHSGAAAFMYVNNALHHCMGSLSDEPIPVRRAKCASVSRLAKHLCTESRAGNIFVDPGSILPLMAPYLLLTVQFREHKAAEKSVNDVVISGLCCIADVVSLPTYSVNETLLLPMASALNEALEDHGKDRWEELCQRVLFELFRSNTATAKDMPASNYLSVLHRCSPAFSYTVYRAAQSVLVTAESSLPEDEFQDAKAASLTALCWQVSSLHLTSSSDRLRYLSNIVSSLETLVSLKYPVLPLINSLVFIITTELQSHVDVAWKLIDRCVRILLGHYSTLVPSLTQPLAMALCTAIDALAEAATKDTLNAGATSTANTMLEALVAATMFHQAQWKVTRTRGPAFLSLWRVIEQLMLRIENFDRPILNGGTTVIQLVADLISFATRGQSHHKYVIDATPTHCLPFPIVLESEGSATAEAPELIRVPGSWTGMPATDGGREKDQLSVDDIRRSAGALGLALIHLAGDFPSNRAGVACPMAGKQNPVGKLTYLLDQVAIGSFVGGERRAELLTHSAVGEGAWEADFVATAECAEAAAVNDEPDESFFAKKALEINDTLGEMLEDFEHKTEFPPVLELLPPNEDATDVNAVRESIMQFTPAAPPSYTGGLSEVSSVIQLQTSTGLIGASDALDRQKPLTAHVKPTASCSHVNRVPDVLAKQPARIPTFSLLTNLGEKKASDELLVAVGEAFGKRLTTPTDTVMYLARTGTHECNLVVESHLVDLSSFSCAVVICDHYDDVARTTHFRRWTLPVIFVLPGPCENTAITFRYYPADIQGTVMDGVCVPLSSLASMLRGLMTGAAMSGVSSSVTERQLAIAQSTALEAPSFEAFLAPLLTGN